ncbi:sulfotransferase family protein [Thermochromatium tepidum]|uniref:sulfotransferase family protein n=1 Tax=Thermochromatium tepidum TaxID=1050 RepID=UPI00138A00E6|nr:sulfotransferase [Thermochromatium tepidum]
MAIRNVWRRSAPKRETPPPILIGGFYRSGTTLLRRLLDAHPEVHCPPELKFMRDLLGEYRDDPYGHLRFSNTCRALPLAESERLAIWGRAYAELRTRAAERLGKRRWADKDPENARYLPYWEQALGSNFVYVHLVRDPLDTLASVREMGFEKSLPPGLAEQVALWRANAEAALQFRERAPERASVLSYEALVKRPGPTLEALLAWLGLEPDDSLIQGLTDPARGRGLEDPKIDRTSGIHGEGLGRGVRELDPASQAFIATELGALYLDLLRASGAAHSIRAR